MIRSLKQLMLPDRPCWMPIVCGPFRGARVMLRPRVSLRKVFGVYEHELNTWIERALDRIHRVIDVGANDGYFTFGCLAAMKRRRLPIDIVAFEPQEYHVNDLRSSIEKSRSPGIFLIPKYCGAVCDDTMATLDSLAANDRENTLIKIDIEGAELDALQGARTWIHPSNLFLIEVHRESLEKPIRELFQANGCGLERIDHDPHWLLGEERRDGENFWLVSPQ